MKKQILLAALVSVACSSAQSVQAQYRCGTQLLLDRINQDPVKQQKLRDIYSQQEQEAAAKGQQQSNPFMKTTAQVIIPVVFHIVLNQGQIDAMGGAVGIQQRIDSQITVLNRDYSATNGDKVNIPAAFAPLQASMEITFGVAHTNPTGGSTSGVVTKVLPATTKYIDEGGDFFADAKYSSNGGSDAWDPTRYLNIWVINPMYGGDTSNLLGIAFPPSFKNFGFQNSDLGVVVNYRAFGKRRFASDKYIGGIDGGRTLTHELGHFFELRHPWGSNEGDCPATGGDDDGIADTPPIENASYSSSPSSCPTFPKTDACSPASPGVMFMNFMDYANDRCLLMFTNNQKTLARSQFDASSDFSYSLTQHPWLINWPQGVEEIDAANSFFIAPNPSRGLFTISFNQQPKGLRRIAVSNSVGQVIRTLEPQSGNAGIYNVDLSGMSKGVYFVQCLFDGASKTEKLVLQ